MAHYTWWIPGMGKHFEFLDAWFVAYTSCAVVMPWYNHLNNGTSKNPNSPQSANVILSLISLSNISAAQSSPDTGRVRNLMTDSYANHSFLLRVLRRLNQLFVSVLVRLSGQLKYGYMRVGSHNIRLIVKVSLWNVFSIDNNEKRSSNW